MLRGGLRSIRTNPQASRGHTNVPRGARTHTHEPLTCGWNDCALFFLSDKGLVMGQICRVSGVPWMTKLGESTCSSLLSTPQLCHMTTHTQALSSDRVKSSCWSLRSPLSVFFFFLFSLLALGLGLGPGAAPGRFLMSFAWSESHLGVTEIWRWSHQVFNTHMRYRVLRLRFLGLGFSV